jgi:hypothetical protein
MVDCDCPHWNCDFWVCAIFRQTQPKVKWIQSIYHTAECCPKCPKIMLRRNSKPTSFCLRFPFSLWEAQLQSSPSHSTSLGLHGSARICLWSKLWTVYLNQFTPKKMINAFKYIQIVFSLLRSSVWHTSLDGDERSTWTATVIWRKLDGEIANNAEIPLPFPLGPHPWLVAC